ncbi:MAG: DMT family transporter [Pirellulales bacterium]
MNSNDDPRAIRRATLLVVAAALLWSSGGFFAKAPYFAGWPGPLLAFWRAAFASVILLPMVRRPVWSWKLIPMVACFALMNYTYLTAMVKGSPANAIWLQSTAPVWVLIVGVFVFREPAHWLDWVLIALCGAGVLFILWFESRGEGLEAFLWGLASGVFYAGIVLSLRHLREYDSAWLVAVNHLATAVLLSWNLAATQYWPHGIQWVMLAGFGMFQMGLPYVLFAKGLKHLPGHRASGIGMLEPILVPVWVYLAWGDVPAWWTLAGGGLILAGLVTRYVSHRLSSAS